MPSESLPWRRRLGEFRSRMTLPPASPPDESRSPVRWLVLGGVWLVYLCFGLTSVALAPIVEPVTRDLALSHSAMGSVLGIWQLVYIVAAIPCGSLLDRLGPGRAVFLGALVIAASGALRSLADDYLTLCLGVAVFGIGGPIVSAGAPKIVSLWFKGRERGLAMGIYITGPALGAILVLSSTNSVLMPWLAGDWRRVLQCWAGMALAGALIWLAVCLHPQVRAMDRRTSAAPRPPQREVLAQLLAIPAVRILLAMSVGIFMFNHGLNNWLPELLRVDGMTAQQAGYWATVPTSVGIFGSLLIPRLATPERRLIILAGLCVSAGLGTILLHAEPGILLLAGLVAQGIARSSLMTIAMLTLVETRGVGERHAGTAGGLFFSAAEIGGATGPIAMGALYDVTGSFHPGLTLLTVISGLLLLGVIRLRALARRV